jgi:hypothetical protein
LLGLLGGLAPLAPCRAGGPACSEYRSPLAHVAPDARLQRVAPGGRGLGRENQVGRLLRQFRLVHAHLDTPVGENLDLDRVGSRDWGQRDRGRRGIHRHRGSGNRRGSRNRGDRDRDRGSRFALEWEANRRAGPWSGSERCRASAVLIEDGDPAPDPVDLHPFEGLDLPRLLARQAETARHRVGPPFAGDEERAGVREHGAQIPRRTRGGGDPPHDVLVGVCRHTSGGGTRASGDRWR